MFSYSVHVMYLYVVFELEIELLDLKSILSSTTKILTNLPDGLAIKEN